MMTVLPLMEHEPGVLELLSMPNVTWRPDDAVPDS